MDDFSDRPWGTWIKLDEGEGYWVKKIIVKPGQRLSLQYHNRRYEKWIIIQGEEAWVNVGYIGRKIFPGDIVEIPIGSEHRIQNTGKKDFVFIEVATGDPDEEDIVRVEDDYGRK